MKKEDDTLSLMVSEFKKIDKIVLLKEEDYVIRSLIRGKSRSKILKCLQKKYPKEQFIAKDIDSFMITYRDILGSERASLEKGYVRRLIKSKTGLNNELIDLAMHAKDMAKRYDEENDNSNAIAAIRAAADIFMKFAKVEGLATDQPEINVNMQMDKIVSQVTSKESDFKNSILKIIETPKDKVVDAEVVDE